MLRNLKGQLKIRGGLYCSDLVILFKLGLLPFCKSQYVYIYKFRAVAGGVEGIWPGQDTSRPGYKQVRWHLRRKSL
jgi:hypothetical protein